MLAGFYDSEGLASLRGGTQNHRTAEGGRPLGDHPVQNPCLEQGCPEQAALDCVQLGFEHL